MKTLVRLLKFLWPFWGWVVLAVLLGTLTIGSSIALMSTSAYLIAAAALHPSIAELNVAIVGVRFFGLARGLFRYLERYVSHQVNFRLLARLRVWFYTALEPLVPARLVAYHSGDLLTRAVADIETLQEFYVRVLAPPFVAVLILCGMSIFFGRFDLTLAGVLLIFLVGTGTGLPTLVRYWSRHPHHHFTQARAELQSQMVDVWQGLPEVLAWGQQAAKLKRVTEWSTRLSQAQQKLAWLNAGQTALGNVLMNSAMLVVVMMGIALINAKQLDGVYLAVLALATLASFEAVFALPLAASSLEAALAAARRLFEIAETPPAVLALGHLKPTATSVDLVVRNLHFRYAPAQSLVLNNLSFELPFGKRVVLLGASGAGKTTLINLLLRFWDYEQGEILWNGVDLRQYAPLEIRQRVGVISQRTYLFNATIRENLLVANPYATPTELVAATEQAQLHSFIESLPQKYETWVGERGLRLSGGERQRLAIARALLRPAPVLMLDEPTAHLDNATAQEFLTTLLRVTHGRTVLWITHQASGLEQFDEVWLMRHGQVVLRE